MRPRLIFSYGLTKSATTYGFHIVALGLARAGYTQHRLPEEILGAARTLNAVEHLHEEHLIQIETLARAWSTRLVLKTHTPPDAPVRDWILRGRAEAHAIYRDPRDVALSMLDHGRAARAAGKPAFAEFRNLEDTFAGLHDQLRSLAAWLSLPGVMPLRFETLTTGDGPARLLRHHGLPGHAGPLAKEVRNTCFIQFNRGQQARHRAEMMPSDAARFTQAFAPFYRHLVPEPDTSPALPPGTALSAMDNPRRPDYQPTNAPGGGWDERAPDQKGHLAQKRL